MNSTASARSRSQAAMGISAHGADLDIAATVAWKDGIVTRLTGGVSGLLRKAKVRLVTGEARLRDGKTAVVDTPEGPVMIHAEALVIATGSAPVELPTLPFGGKVMSSTDALSLHELPASLAVVGGGYIGLELGIAFAKFGTKVTVIEAAPRILPQYDSDLTKPVSARLSALGITVLTRARAGGLGEDGALRVAFDDAAEDIAADRILVTVGRLPRSDAAGIPGLRLDMDGRFIRIDGPLSHLDARRLCHWRRDRRADAGPSRHGTGRNGGRDHRRSQPRLDKRAIPAVCFTDPENRQCRPVPRRGGHAGA
ncbi:hypothetical protein HA402_009810 [Bradysia odoriphaga]|nr:hypothetical protein HA402_009810 [Bradysia odoriphaga]